MSRSILEIDEARRRLEQMDADHRTIVELVQKLKSVRESLTTTLDGASNRLRLVEQLSERFTKTEGDLTRALVSFKTQSETSLKTVAAAGRDLEKQYAELLRSTAEQLEALKSKLLKTEQEQKSEFDGWIRKQNKRFEKFEEQNRSDLERVAKAYERAKVVLDAHTPLIDGLDSRVEELSTLRESLALTFGNQVKALTDHMERTVTDIREANDRDHQLMSARVDAIKSHLESNHAATTKELAAYGKGLKRARFFVAALAIVMTAGICSYGYHNWEAVVELWRHFVTK